MIHKSQAMVERQAVAVIRAYRGVDRSQAFSSCFGPHGIEEGGAHTFFREADPGERADVANAVGQNVTVFQGLESDESSSRAF